MALVHVDVDLDDVDVDELVDEVCRRLKRYSIRGQLSPKQKEAIKDSVTQLYEAIYMYPDSKIEILTLDDKMKYDHFANVFKKYSSSDIEKLLP